MDSPHNQHLPEIQISEHERREILAEVAKRLSEENIEDWDFRDPDLAENDPIADLFLSMNYTTVWAVELTRLEYIKTLLESPFAELSEDKRAVLVPRANDDFWRGFTKGSLRESLTEDGRFEKRVRKSLEREWRKYGCLKPTILPLPGSASRRSDSVGHETGAGASMRLQQERGEESTREVVKDPSDHKHVAERIIRLAADREQAPTLYRFVFRLVDAGFVRPLVRYLSENDEMELRILSTVRISDEDLEELVDVSTTLALACLHKSSRSAGEGSQLALELAALQRRRDVEIDLLNLDPMDPDFKWESIFAELLQFTVPATTAAPEMTPEMQRGANVAVLTVNAFPQLKRVIDVCLTGDRPGAPPTRRPFDYYDAQVWWEIDVSSVEAPSLAQALSELTADQMAALEAKTALSDSANQIRRQPTAVDSAASPQQSGSRTLPGHPPEPTPSVAALTERRNSDVGLEVVAAIAAMMAIDEEWTTRDERGFTWWGKDHAQRVWSEPGCHDDGVEIFRLHARTSVLRDFESTDENLAKLNALSMVATMSAFLIDPEERTVDLAASMYVHAETADWIRRWFGMAVAVQAADAQSKAALLAEVTGATAATSAHPTSGPRPEPDDMLGILEDVPRADERCPWQGEAMLAVVEAARTAGNTVIATGDETGLTAELPFQSETSLLTVATSEQHPQIGNGVLVRLQLPVVFSEEEGPRFAMELNRRELTQLTRSHFLGSWCWHDGFVQFVTFVPNLLHLGGADLFNFVASSYSRAKWIAESIYGDDWASNRDEKGRPLATPAVADLVRDPIDHEPSADRPSEDEEWNPLNKELFDLGGDAYGNASLDVVMQAATGQLLPVPQFAKDRALFLVERTTSEKFLRRYADSFFEAFGVAFRLVWAEEWEDLDEDYALELIDDGLRRLRDEHIRNGVAEPIDLSDVEQRAIVSVMGLVGTHPTFEQVREYLFSRAAYRRLSTLDDLHLEMGIAASGVARRDTEAFWNGQLVAWKTGQAFAILDFVGQLDGEDSGATVGSYSETVLEGMRLAATYDVDLVELANSIIAQVSEAHRDSATGRVWFPAEAIRALCCMEFLVTSELSDPRLDEAFMRSAQSPSDEATSRVSEIGQQVIEERGLTPVIDALLELIKDPDAPPASELL